LFAVSTVGPLFQQHVLPSKESGWDMGEGGGERERRKRKEYLGEEKEISRKNV
jgi:hypothetical protein